MFLALKGLMQVATSGLGTLSYIATATASSSSITIPASAQQGDIAIIGDWATNVGSTPSTAVPSGWTSAINTNGTTSSYGHRMICSYRLLGSSPGGTSVTGMTGALTYKVMHVFRCSGSTALAVGDAEGQISSTAPTDQTLAAGGVPGPLIMVGFGYAGSGIACGPGTFTYTSNGFVSLGYEIAQTTGSDRTVSESGYGPSSGAGLQSFYLTVD